jgi:hypothetical protein
MSALFKPPTVNIPAPPAPTPIPPPPMPDPFNPAAQEAAKMQAATRAGRSATILTNAANRGAASVGVPYSGRTLGGGG